MKKFSKEIYYVFTESVKVTNKGQVTLPKKVREFINSKIITFDILNGQVTIKPIKNVGGSLSKYSKVVEPFEKIIEQAWQESLGKIDDE